MDSLLTYERMSAEVWDLAFGLEGMKGRMPTRREEFERIAKVQDVETKRKLVEWLNLAYSGEYPSDGTRQRFIGFTIPLEDWQALRKEVGLSE